MNEKKTDKQRKGVQVRKDFNIDVDKRKIEIKGDVKSIGDYDAVIKVHPTITAKIKVHITAE